MALLHYLGAKAHAKQFFGICATLVFLFIYFFPFFGHRDPVALNGRVELSLGARVGLTYD